MKKRGKMFGKKGREGNSHFNLFNNSNTFAKSKRSQVTIFIILAIAIVAVLLFLFMPNIKTLIYGPVPQDYVKDCIEDAVDEFLPSITLQGGTLNPENYFMYRGDKIEYLCYTNDYYKKCVMQKPFLKQDIEEEIEKSISGKAEQCIQNLKRDLEKKGASVSVGKINADVSIVPSHVITSINADMSVTKEATSSYEKFRVEKRSELYNLIMISTSIMNWEARYGDSDPQTYMLYYPNVRVEKKKQGDGTTVYILTNKKTEEKLQFASRSMAFPEGYVADRKIDQV